MENKKIIVAIDGLSGCGKSSTAKSVASHLKYIYVDTGAMYRAVTLYFLKKSIDLNDPFQITEALGQIHLSFTFDEFSSTNEIWLNGENVEKEIRGLDVSARVSEVAAIPDVRRKMVQLQRKMGAKKGLVMDGRDIGSVVFPCAELKVFMTADAEVRAKRRLLELQEKGLVGDYDEILENLVARDNADMNRDDSPLVKPENAVEIDTSSLNFEEQVSQIVELANNIISPE